MDGICGSGQIFAVRVGRGGRKSCRLAVAFFVVVVVVVVVVFVGISSSFTFAGLFSGQKRTTGERRGVN
jgi:hypothetical protein